MKAYDSGCPLIENAIYNWYLGGEDADPYPIVNALSIAVKDDIELIMNVQPFDPASLDDPSLMEQLPEEIDGFQKMTLQLIDDKEQGTYWFPIYTNETEVGGDEDTSMVPLSLREILDQTKKWPGCKGAIINPWGRDIHLDPDFIDQILAHTPLSHMTLNICPFEQARADLKVTFSPYMKNTGLVKELTVPDSTALYRLEGATPIYTGKYSDERLLAACYRNALDFAYERNCQSVAFPVPVRFPIEKAVAIAAGTTVKWFVAHKDSVIDVYFICRDQLEKDEYNRYFDSDQKIPQHIRDLRMGAAAYNRGEFEQAYILYKASADAGNVTALSNLGYCYYFGNGVEADREAAYSCWRKAAEAGDACALYKMGDLYFSGEIRQDASRALNYYIRSFNIAKADKDLFAYPDVCLRLAKYYGDVLKPKKRDYLINEAIKYFRIRIEKGTSYTEGVLKEAEDLKEQYTQ